MTGAFVLASPATAQESLSDDRLVRNFELIALRSEYRAIENPHVVKWTGPVRIYLEMDVRIEAVVEADLRRHMARLARLTGLEMRYVDNADDANFQIVFTNINRMPAYIRRFSGRNAHLESLLTRADCIGFFGTRRTTGEIVRAAAIIPVDHARERGILFACIVEETTQVLGLPNDANDVVPSVFNDSTITEDLTWQDEFLIRMLYHPRMRPGLARDDAIRTAREIVPELRRQ